MKIDLLFGITIALAMGSCEDGDGGHDTDEERSEAIDGSDRGESDPSEISDTSMEDIPNEDMAQEEEFPSACEPMAVPGCGEGRLWRGSAGCSCWR